MKYIGQFPHCDQRVLHAPGDCKYCDSHQEWQELRQAWGIAFTGQEPVDEEHHKQLPCPSDFNRGKSGAHVWGGNYPRAHLLTDCPDCQGVGYDLKLGDKCGTCQGSGLRDGL